MPKTNTPQRDEFIISYLPKIEAIVKRLNPSDKYIEDLIQAGMIGVIKAYDNYNNKSKYYLSHNLWSMVSRELWQCLKKLNPIYQNCTINDVSLNDIYRILNEDYPLNSPTEIPLSTIDIENLKVEGEISPEDQTISNIYIKRIYDYLVVEKHLDLYYYCLKHRYGFEGEMPKQNIQIAKQINKSRSDIYHFLKKAGEKVRELYEKELNTDKIL